MESVAVLKAALAGRYEIERQIRAGGMATVYLARDLKHERPVALKMLNPELGAVLGVEMLRPMEDNSRIIVATNWLSELRAPMHGFAK